MKKIICIAGHSGAGKTTCCEYLTEHLDAEHVKVDEFYKRTPIMYPKLFEQIYGTPPDLQDIKNTHDLIKYGDVVQEKEFFDSVLPTMNSLLLKLKDEFISNGDKKYLLLDWAGIGRTDLWKEADYKMLVCSNKQKRYNALQAREHKKYGKTRKDLGHLRDQVYGSAVEKAEKSANIMLYNNYDENFFEMIKLVNNGIIKRKSVTKMSHLTKMKADAKHKETDKLLI